MTIIRGGLIALVAMLAMGARSADAAPPKPVAGQQVRFEQGYWSGLPQAGPDGKVRQCVMVARRPRKSGDGTVDTRFSVNVSRGAGLVFAVNDDGLPRERVLDDQAEIVIDGRAFPAVAFNVGPAFAFHPGDAKAAAAALGRAAKVTLRADGAGLDTGAVTIDLPAEALAWLTSCAATFDIALDRATDPHAPDLPVPRPRSAKVAPAKPTQAGPAGIEDKQKIEGWDASELRNGDGTIFVCMIRRHYATGSEPDARRLGIFLMASRLRGVSMMVKDSSLKLPENKPVEASLAVGKTPFPQVTMQAQGSDEIGIFPQAGGRLLAALEAAPLVSLKPEGGESYEFSMSAGVLGWLRACARRNAIALEPASP
ncbi:hypothetical protein [Bradyrhizobium sp. ORS 285]|uniref:hypothetical protein n=1 Tax=Bradyrhizobium sp. ORS 285 TaxID=115808 RepID=UPI0002D40FB6|nr:hypothetical protein [Bradyrhizobium sp. ORS 285]